MRDGIIIGPESGQKGAKESLRLHPMVVGVS